MHKHRIGASSLAVVAALTLALAGCSGGGEESPPSEASESAPAAETTPTPTPTPEPTPEPVATPLTPEQAWDQSLCAALDTATLEAVTGRVYHGGEVSGANSQLPINDRCTVFLLDPATAETTPDVATITFGVSAATVDAAGWQRISDTYAATLGTYLTITPLEVADGGFAVFEGSRAWAHAGDRVVYVSDTSQSGLSTDAYPTLLAAAHGHGAGGR